MIDEVVEVRDTEVVVIDGECDLSVVYIEPQIEVITLGEGAPGPGVPAGGTAGQLLEKIDTVNYHTRWIDPNVSGPDVYAFAADQG